VVGAGAGAERVVVGAGAGAERVVVASVVVASVVVASVAASVVAEADSASWMNELEKLDQDMGSFGSGQSPPVPYRSRTQDMNCPHICAGKEPPATEVPWTLYIDWRSFG